MLDAAAAVDDRYYSPLSNVLVKGVEEGNDWMLYLEASNEHLDQDNEIIESGALRKAKDYYLGHGVISWDHKHKIKDDPLYIIGDPLDVKFSQDGRTLVKGRLYQHNRIARNLWDNIRSAARMLGASIGGNYLHKAADRVKRVLWDETAVTHKPINDLTYGSVQAMPFPEFMKAMMAGAGVNPEGFSGGRAMIPESMQGTDHRVARAVVDELSRSVLDGIIKGKIESYEQLEDFVASRGHSDDTARKIASIISRKFRRQ